MVKMDKETLDVICCKDAVQIKATLELYEYDEEVEIKLYLTDTEYVSGADNFFDALVDIRKKLESHNIKLLCAGCLLNVYPSAMILNMGSGRKAYCLHFGKQASMDDIVDIFSSCGEKDVASVDEQKAYFAKWIDSFGKGKE